MTTDIGHTLRRAVAALQGRARFAVVGGLAVSARSEPRFTKDVDFAIAVGDEFEAEQLVGSLVSEGYLAAAIVEHEVTGRLLTVRLQHPADEGRLVDLLFGSSGIEAEVVAGATAVPFPRQLSVPVASVGHLIAMKLVSVDPERRPHDATDLNSLAAVATDDDWAVAAEAVALIEARGYHRDRDLGAALVALRHRFVG